MFTFRTALLTDIELLQTLARQIWTSHYASILSASQIEYMLELMYSSTVIEQELNTGVVWEVVEMDSIPIGFISYAIHDKELKLNKLYISPSYHGKGLGQKALSHVMDTTKNNHLQKLYLTVNKNNEKAIKAYEKAGLIRTDSKVFDIGNGYVMDDYIYTYLIK